MSHKLAPNVVPFSLKLHTPASPGSKQQLLGTLRVSSDGRVRADAMDAEMQSYLADMAQKLNRRVVTFAMVGPNAQGHFESVTQVVEHDDPEFAEALKLRVEGEYGLIVEEAA
jgi:hypothetical protein